MKFSAIFGSLAIYGLQVHAIPTDLDPQAIQPIEASSPIPNTLEARDTYCCVGLQDPSYNIASFIPRGSGTYYWAVSNDYDGCVVMVQRNPTDCRGWTFRVFGCPDFDPSVNVAIRPAGDCH
ncbi:hypothetical protein E4U30_004682 [Claviceps sp. LM220 group G6]|nr:hypothetical protein E4U30_004682 [Claviceps sp. LM220 group G6]KAG6102688.1 hypothetical protein E4U31_003312 [Claviceps sp. LM219 group G6]KAG6113433.1 hypothetical protein E4U14_001733 [Claviceps sp. LM454 group G7]